MTSIGGSMDKIKTKHLHGDPILDVYTSGLVRNTAETSQAIQSSFSLANGYGLFRTMTGVNGRYELTIYGSYDNKNWKIYEFLHKPTKLKNMPTFIAPHQPRLDWQLWFSALSPGLGQRDMYLQTLLFRLLHNSKSVLSLFKSNPFLESPPQYIKISSIIYKFTEYSKHIFILIQ